MRYQNIGWDNQRIIYQLSLISDKDNPVRAVQVAERIPDLSKHQVGTYLSHMHGNPFVRSAKICDIMEVNDNTKVYWWTGVPLPKWVVDNAQWSLEEELSV
jgi:hypothetical protein